MREPCGVPLVAKTNRARWRHRVELLETVTAARAGRPHQRHSPLLGQEVFPWRRSPAVCLDPAFHWGNRRQHVASFCKMVSADMPKHHGGAGSAPFERHENRGVTLLSLRFKKVTPLPRHLLRSSVAGSAQAKAKTSHACAVQNGRWCPRSIAPNGAMA